MNKAGGDGQERRAENVKGGAIAEIAEKECDAWTGREKALPW